MEKMTATIASTEKKLGFTLIELMIVVAIIGILSAVAIPKFAEMMRRAREATTKGGLTHLKSALTLYVSDNEGIYPTDNLNCLNIKYIDSIPVTKISPYHPDKNTVRTTQEFVTAAGAPPDSGEWIYCNENSGLFFIKTLGQICVLCFHTDMKNTRISNW